MSNHHHRPGTWQTVGDIPVSFLLEELDESSRMVQENARKILKRSGDHDKVSRKIEELRTAIEAVITQDGERQAFESQDELDELCHYVRRRIDEMKAWVKQQRHMPHDIYMAMKREQRRVQEKIQGNYRFPDASPADFGIEKDPYFPREEDVLESVEGDPEGSVEWIDAQLSLLAMKHLLAFKQKLSDSDLLTSDEYITALNFRLLRKACSCLDTAINHVVGAAAKHLDRGSKYPFTSMKNDFQTKVGSAHYDIAGASHEFKAVVLSLSKDLSADIAGVTFPQFKNDFLVSDVSIPPKGATRRFDAVSIFLPRTQAVMGNGSRCLSEKEREFVVGFLASQPALTTDQDGIRRTLNDRFHGGLDVALLDTEIPEMVATIMHSAEEEEEDLRVDVRHDFEEAVEPVKPVDEMTGEEDPQDEIEEIGKEAPPRPYDVKILQGTFNPFF